MTDWKLQQMIKASGWPLAAEHLAPGADFNARLDGGLVPLHWACAAGKQGVVQHSWTMAPMCWTRRPTGRRR